ALQVEEMRQGFRDLGYVEGKNIVRAKISSSSPVGRRADTISFLPSPVNGSGASRMSMSRADREPALSCLTHRSERPALALLQTAALTGQSSWRRWSRWVTPR